jgi:diadenosine tetraphosphate (Ap4A) HIT family hydrolase
MAGVSVRLRAPDHRRFLLDPVCISCTSPEDDPSTLGVASYWKLVLHPDQTVPGALLIVSLRHVPKISDLTEAEALEFFALAAAVERVMESELGATMVNFSCLRNWAFREKDPVPPKLRGLPNPHVHWHVAPRYERPVSVAGEVFIDREFGEELRWQARNATEAVSAELATRLSSALDVR